jgi:hypothetical protein
MPFKEIATAAGWIPSRLIQPRILLAVLVWFSCVAMADAAPDATKSADTETRLVDRSGLNYHAKARPYLAESVKHLVKRIPELGTLRRARDQRELPAILEQTGARVADFFRNMVDVVAREEVSQEVLGPAGVVVASQKTKYDYLILANGQETPPAYDEYRTDAQGQQTEQGGVEQGYAITIGFALKCVYFLPALRSHSRFRYLGEQVIGGRDSYVVAFAQRPQDATYWGTVRSPWGSVRILDQGIAWIDKNTFQILRVRTDLLAAHREIGLAEQTTEVTFGEVRLADLAHPLWLPCEARVYALFQGQAFRNEHWYTDYERFRVSVKMGEARY